MTEFLAEGAFTKSTIVSIRKLKALAVHITSEYRNYFVLSKRTHLTLNLAKTKEIVFKRPRARCFHLPPAIDNIEQLDCNKLLGVFFSQISKWTCMFRIYWLSALSECT